MTRGDRDAVVPLRIPVPVAVTQGTLALDLEPLLDPPSAPPQPLPGRGSVVPRGGGSRLRSAEQWCHRYVQAAVEIVGGDRPASQLARWTDDEVYADLARRALLVARAGGHTPGVRRVQPVRPRVRSSHVSEVTDGVVEAAVHVQHGHRSRAVAVRFEEVDGRWLCTALEFA